MPHLGNPPTASAGRGNVTPARIAAAHVAASLRSGAFLDAAFDRAAERLDTRDRRWLQELV